MKCDTMKPRFEQQSYEVTQLIEKASVMKNRISVLEKAKTCKDCDKTPCDCKDCPECGGKMNKMGCMKMGCGGKMYKAEEEYKLPKQKITDVNPELHSESGGQTRNAYYTTNGISIESEDVKPKRSKDGKKTDLQGLGKKMNPHEGSGADKENFMGGE